MYFLQPLALLLLAAALVPPLLHLFQRRRPPDVAFPAVRYLRQTEREASRTIRLRHLLLLLLRVAAVALLALAAARPVVPGGAGAAHEPTAVVIVLDHSLSSGAVAAGVRTFDDLAARARETLGAVRSADAVWLVGADGIARRGSRDELLRVVAAARPEARRLDLSAAVAAAARLVRASGYARAEIHVLSDLQRSAFGASDSAAAGLPLLFYHPAADAPGNRAVVQARATPATWLAGAAGAVAVAVGGAPAPAAAKAAVTAAIAGKPGGHALMGPGDAGVLPVPAPAAGWVAGEVTLEPDELRADDRRPFAVRVVAPAAVVLDARADAGPFLPEALRSLAGAGLIRLVGAGAALAVTVGESAPAGGGAAVVFPPHDPVGLGAANRALSAAGVPWRFGARLEREDTLAAGPSLAPGVAGAQIHRRYRLEPALPGAGGVLARAGGDPWLVRSGHIVLFASRLVSEETSLPVSSGFVPFVGDVVNRLARGEEGIVEAAPGDPVRLDETITGIAEAPGRVRPVEGGRGAAPAEPGVYPLLAGTDTAGALVVAPDPRESDLRRATASDLAALFPGARVVVAASPRAYAAVRFRAAGRAELTGAALLAALLVLLVESVVAAGGLGREA